MGAGRPGRGAVSGVRRLADQIGIRDVILGYARPVVRKDLEAVARCFTQECAYEGSLASGRFARALDRLRGAFERYTRTMHVMGTQDVAVDGDAARARTYCIAFHVRTDGRHTTVAVRYDDALVRTGDGWRIARRAVATVWTRDDPPAPPA
jgi:ketosteroid isomerase-like protein